MHDLFEGVCRYNLAKIIQHCINKNYVILKRLNYRIKYFNHQSDFDRGNKIPLIRSDHINKGYLIMSSAEMSALVCYLSLIIGDLVPDYDEVWDFYLTLCTIIKICTENIISDDQVNYLRYLIFSHHEMFMRLFKEQLKPKFHFMTHYPEIIRKIGPLKYLFSIRYEGFHKLSKTYAAIVTSQKNIISSLAIKLQLQFAYRLLIKKGLNDSLKVEKNLRLLSTKLTNVLHIDSQYREHLTEVSWIKFNNILFKRNFVIITDFDENNLSFGIMMHVMLDEKENIFVCYRKCITLGLDIHFNAYEISLPCENNEICVIKVSKPLTVKTCNYHTSGDSRYFISLFNI